MAKEAVAQGYRAVKTNPVFFDRPKPHFFNGGFRIAPGFLDRSITDRQHGQIVEQMTAYREAIGPDVGLMLDLSFSQRTDGYLRIAQRLEPLNLAWLELDMNDPEAPGLIRRSSRVPIASLESLHGIAEYRPFLQGQTVDTGIVDPMWNGVWQSARIAQFADAYETTFAPHNPVGELGSLMSAHLSAAVPNFRIMELRVARRASADASTDTTTQETALRIVYWARLQLGRQEIIAAIGAARRTIYRTLPYDPPADFVPVATTGQRTRFTPEVPTLSELGYDVVFQDWSGLLAPAGTPREIVQRVNAAVADIIRSPAGAAAMDKLGSESDLNTPEQFATLYRRATWERYREVVKATGFTAED